MLPDALAFLKMFHDGGLNLAMAALGVAAWWYERKQNQLMRDEQRVLQDKLFELAKAQISSNIKQEAALDALKLILQLR